MVREHASRATLAAQQVTDEGQQDYREAATRVAPTTRITQEGRRTRGAPAAGCGKATGVTRALALDLIHTTVAVVVTTVLRNLGRTRVGGRVPGIAVVERLVDVERHEAIAVAVVVEHVSVALIPEAVAVVVDPVTHLHGARIGLRVAVVAVVYGGIEIAVNVGRGHRGVRIIRILVPLRPLLQAPKRVRVAGPLLRGLVTVHEAVAIDVIFGLVTPPKEGEEQEQEHGKERLHGASRVGVQEIVKSKI